MALEALRKFSIICLATGVFALSGQANAQLKKDLQSSFSEFLSKKPPANTIRRIDNQSTLQLLKIAEDEFEKIGTNTIDVENQEQENEDPKYSYVFVYPNGKTIGTETGAGVQVGSDLQVGVVDNTEGYYQTQEFGLQVNLGKISHDLVFLNTGIVFDKTKVVEENSSTVNTDEKFNIVVSGGNEIFNFEVQKGLFAKFSLNDLIARMNLRLGKFDLFTQIKKEFPIVFPSLLVKEYQFNNSVMSFKIGILLYPTEPKGFARVAFLIESDF